MAPSRPCRGKLSSLVLLSAGVGCAARSPGSGSSGIEAATVGTVAHGDAPVLPLVPMQLVAAGPSTAPVPGLTLEAGGGLTLRGSPFGRVEGSSIVTVDGTVILQVEADGRLVSRGVDLGRLTARGDVESPRGTIHVDDDGTPYILRQPDGRRDPGPLRVIGFNATARPTATVLVVLLLVLIHPPTQNDAGVSAPVPHVSGGSAGGKASG